MVDRTTGELDERGRRLNCAQRGLKLLRREIPLGLEAGGMYDLAEVVDGSRQSLAGGVTESQPDGDASPPQQPIEQTGRPG